MVPIHLSHRHSIRLGGPILRSIRGLKAPYPNGNWTGALSGKRLAALSYREAREGANSDSQINLYSEDTHPSSVQILQSCPIPDTPHIRAALSIGLLQQCYAKWIFKDH